MAGFSKAKFGGKKLRIALIGPTGSGKSYTALRIAKGIGGRIAVIDSENGSASLYADVTDFDVDTLLSFGVDRYLESIRAAERERFDVLVIDSLSHAWMGPGGILEYADKKAEQSANGNRFAGWKWATPKHNELMQAILNSPCHIIVTLRSKMEYVQEKDERGKLTVRKVGLQPVQRDGIEFEFDLICDIDQEHELRVSKTRFAQLDGRTIVKAGEDFGADVLRVASGTAATAVTTAPQNDITKARETIAALLADMGTAPQDQARVVSSAIGRKPETLTDYQDVVAALTDVAVKMHDAATQAQ